ncbi:MAG: CsbD family protein [Aquincola tertiaricarbonis]|uniref:CsbD family protein n=1 Tax=Aquincola TaxID=391952 RepID=UPI000614F80F|nr:MULTISPECIES: CsbD family protein [Aquincola]MCR5866274.1 CsbD family protein [Aquincola sp. J276]
MNNDQVKGRVDDAKGHVKEAVGKAVGNDRLAAEGVADQVKGTTQKNYGDAKEDIKDVVKGR